MHTTHAAATVSADRLSGATLPRVVAAWQRPSARRKLQVALGVAWLVDAALQYQPSMFARAFVTDTIEPTASGAPWVVAHPTLWASHLMIHHIAVYNSVFATVQLVIALAIFHRPLVRFGLGLSVAWGLGVWWLAEGIGGIFDNASPLTGAPGAVLLYVVVALLVWPRPAGGAEPGASVAEQGALGARPSRLAWSALWAGFVLLVLERTNRAPSAVHDLILGGERGEPAWIKAIDRVLAALAAHHGNEISIGLAVAFAAVGLSVWDRRTARAGVLVAAALGLVIWLVEDLGAIATGAGTDLNSGPLLILLAACFWPLPEAAGQLPPRDPGAGGPSTPR
ncbi:hypothetical protein K6U06_15635 [Acidiferrimicrobium sp. IK]|uniref:hypothetical protein n=1 Tax=Acidiferrimicrobium sp. IK TaxID=2871700 RepID=UPI0021CB0362|nr:hypothetical protein [Acidiferrimicrobium sp. IK]MCU4185800.1 hypothetical protein [Acidiferrimicrobium sp. IK]